MSRDVSLLHPRLQTIVKQLQSEFPMLLVTETFRTVAEQDELYAQGRTKPGNIVTNAKGSSYQSQHQWGIAFDFAYNQSGNLYPTSFMNEVANRAKQLGLAWGGDWTDFKDTPHLYLPDWGSTPTSLKQAYGTPDAFKKTWGSTGSSNGNVSQGGGSIPSSDTSSIVDWMKANGMDSSYANRAKLASQYGIANYSGTASQNTQLLNILKGGGNTPSVSVEYYPKPNYLGGSLVDALKSINVDSSYGNRQKIANANGISNYGGTASQNIELLNKLKSGTLKK